MFSFYPLIVFLRTYLSMNQKSISLIGCFTLILCFSNCAQETTKLLPFEDVTESHLISNNTDNNSMDAAVVDIDKDGDLDLILAMEFVENIILINDGTGKLTDESAIRFPRTRHDSEDIAVADFDGDSDLDIVFVSEDDQVNEYFENTGDGTFTDKSEKISVRGTSNSIEAADLNQDGAVDLVIGNAGQNFILINDGIGNFTDETDSRLPSNGYTTQDLELADIDNDGDLDIIEGNETFNRILLNSGSGVFEDKSAELLPQVNDQTREVDLGDIDNDGDLDIIYANVDFGGVGDPQNRLLLNDGTGKFSEITSQIPTSNLRTVDIDFVDINKDGYLDILSGNRWNGLENLVLINDGNAVFTDKTSDFFPNMNIYVFDYQVADFNGDGIDDIYLCGFRGDDNLLFGKAD